LRIPSIRRGANLLDKLETSLPGVWEIRPKVFRDARGFFLETYQQASFSAEGMPDVFVQDNHSFSERGTLRGLHYQLRHPQAKLCRVIEGEALDVSVDIRWGSPTFGKWTSVLLSAKDHNQIYIPRGFAHGFLALTEVVQFLYKCSDFYEVADNYGILWNDPAIAIPWGIEAPLLSEKDRRHPTLATVPQEHLPLFERP
jgi:dTDP-4-dehydrorhamnose 3,5-epimerase